MRVVNYIAFNYIRSVVTSAVAFAEIVTATASQNSIPSEQKQLPFVFTESV